LHDSPNITGVEIKENEMGGTRSTRERDEKCKQYFGWKSRRGRDQSESVGIDARKVLEWVLRIEGRKASSSG
jgi:hypothetical protein